jgi:hypothetical protein
MNNPALIPPGDPSAAARPSLRDAVSSAVRFWERRRLAYNLTLTALVLGLVARDWSHFRPVFTYPAYLLAFAYMLFLAALANICYSAAYPVDFALQLSPAPDVLRRCRVILWWAGLLVAIALACYWMEDEIIG